MNSLLTTQKLIEHKGHKIEIVTYGGENIALECIDCYEVLSDSDLR